MRVLLVALFLLLPLSAWAGDGFRGAGIVDSYRNSSNVYIHDGDRKPIHHSGPDFGEDIDEDNNCFPHGCGEISAPLHNPNPEDRTPENIPACYYDRDNTLIVEQENKDCPYKYVDENVLRVERRKQEWIRSQAR